MKKMYVLPILLLPLLFYIGCGGQNTNADQAEETIPVKVEPVSLGDITQSLSYNGDINAETEVKVFSKVSDRIEEFYVEEGDRVQKGDPIARIRATTIEQTVKQAKAGLVAAQAQEANARVEYERAKRLYREDAMSKQQYDAVETKYEAAKAQLEQAEANLASAKSRLDDATVSASISGIIGTKHYEQGDMANPSMPLVTIVQMDRVKIKFDVTEEDLGKINTGQTVYVSVKSFPDRTFQGKVSKIRPVLDPMTRMANVEALIDNPNKLLKPGMYARVKVITGKIEDVVVIPRYATIENTSLEKIDGEDQVVKNFYVYVVDSNKAFQKKLDVLYVNHRNLAVRSGIDVGEKLVVTGQNNLRDSVAVSISKEEGSEL